MITIDEQENCARESNSELMKINRKYLSVVILGLDGHGGLFCCFGYTYLGKSLCLFKLALSEYVSTIALDLYFFFFRIIAQETVDYGRFTFYLWDVGGSVVSNWEK
jgi:hypothetical protein